MTADTLGTPDGLMPATSEHKVVRLPKREQIAEIRLADALGRPLKQCLSCGEIGAHWIASRLDDNGLLVEGRFACEVGA